MERKVFILKRDINDTNNHVSELKEFIDANQANSDSSISTEYQYNNPDSNKSYFDSNFYRQYLLDNTSIFGRVIKNYVSHYNKKHLKICVIGGGNLSETRAIDFIAGNNDIIIDLTIVDRTIWPLNTFSYNYNYQDENFYGRKVCSKCFVGNLSHINSITIIRNDMFDEFKDYKDDYDIVVFSRLLNYGDYFNATASGELTYLNNLTTIMKNILEKTPMVISIFFKEENMKLTESSINFDKKLHDWLYENGICCNKKDTNQKYSKSTYDYLTLKDDNRTAQIEEITNEIIKDIEEIEKSMSSEEVEISVGMKIEHPKFGKGEITEIIKEKEMVIVNFEDKGTKNLAMNSITYYIK